MNKFAGNITVKGNPKVDLDFDFVLSLSKTGDKNIFIFGETELKTKTDFLNFLKEKFEILNYDLSFSTENKIEIIGESYDEGLYEVASFEGEEVDFNEIMDRFGEFEEVVCVRESEISEKFGNKIIKVDFVY